MYMIAKTTPSTMPSVMAQTVMISVLTRPERIAGAVKNCATTGQAISPLAKARPSQTSTARMSTVATQRP